MNDQSCKKVLDDLPRNHHTKADGFSIARTRCRQPLLTPCMREAMGGSYAEN